MRSIDGWFWCRYTLNPYNGCQFGCIYCDARSAKYHMPDDFETRIIIKQNAKSLLRERLEKTRTWQPDVVALGGVTDCYQPAERKFRSTRGCLRIFLEYGFPIHLITKSTFVTEDAGLLDAIACKTWAGVSITLTTINKSHSKFLEKHAPTPAKRLKTIQKLKERAPHLLVGVTLMPVVPGFGEDPDSLEALFRAISAAGADYVLFGSGMTLRDQQADWFLKHVYENYAHLIPMYEKLFRFKYATAGYAGSYGISDLDWHIRLNATLLELAAKYKLRTRIPRWIPPDYRAVNYHLAEEFLNAAWLAQACNRPGSGILFRVGHALQNLKLSVEEIVARNEWSRLPALDEALKRRIRHAVQAKGQPALFSFS